MCCTTSPIEPILLPTKQETLNPGVDDGDEISLCLGAVCSLAQHQIFYHVPQSIHAITIISFHRLHQFQHVPQLTLITPTLLFFWLLVFVPADIHSLRL